jgi:cell division protein FtsW
MARTLRSDKLLFWATLVLVGLSVLMVYSASAVMAMDKYDDPVRFAFKQVAWVVLGVGLLLVVMRIDYHVYRHPAVIWTTIGVTVVLLLAVFLFPARNGTHRWIILGGSSFQPSELAKLAVIFFVAALLDRRMHRINDPAYALAPIAIVTGGFVALILKQPDFGTSAVIVVIAAAMVFAAGLSYRYLVTGALLLLPAAVAFALLEPYRVKRLTSFLNPWADPYGSGYQIIQSLIAVGSGGVLGRGLMNGVQKLAYLPEAHTDFIFAVVGEELGLIGTTLVVVCFAVVAWRGLRTALVAPDRFGALLAIGVTAMVAVQAFFNISVNIQLMPAKGIPLPFVSSGGSSLLVNMLAMGILLNISQRGSARAAEALRPAEAYA